MAFAGSIAMGRHKLRNPKFDLSRFTGIDNTKILQKEIPWLDQIEERSNQIPAILKGTTIDLANPKRAKEGGISGIL